MTWRYHQRSGYLERDGQPAGWGYSGTDDGDGLCEPGEGLNCPEMQEACGVGPIPRGRWQLVELLPSTASHGPYVIRLQPAPQTVTFGRDGFLVHGDSRKRPGTASLGCIILSRPVRERMWMSGDRELEVVA